jgi:hypothetical protein
MRPYDQRLTQRMDKYHVTIFYQIRFKIFIRVYNIINYNWRCCSSTRQTSSSHQSVTRDDIADIIFHLVLIASTHCMSWLP